LRPRQILGFCIAGLAALYLIEILYHGTLCAFYPYDLNYGEGYVLNDALRLWRGEPIWTDITQFPMVRSPYPPLYLLVTGLLTAPAPSFLGPRLVSLLSTLAIGGMLVWHARRVSFGWQPAVLAATIWLGSTFAYQWAPLARVDMLGLALSLAAVLVAERAPIRGRTLGLPRGLTVGGSLSRIPLGGVLAVAVFLCSLALLTKQTYYAAPLAIALWLVVHRDRRVLWFAAGVLVIVGGGSLALNSVTSGQYAQHVLLGNAANSYRLDRTIEMLGLFLRLNAIALAAGVLAVLFNRWWLRTPTGLYFLLGLATLITVGNVSSDVNYFLEATVGLGLAAPFAWTAVETRLASPVRRLAPVLAVAQLLLLFHVPNGLMVHYPPGPAKGSTPVAEDLRIGDRVEAIVRDAGPGALAELAGFSVLAGAPVWIQPVDLQAEQKLGRWTPDMLNASIAAHRWSVVVLSYKFLPPESLTVLEREYEQTDGLSSPNGFSYFVYPPRSG
jgi:hypothetical protein